MLIYDRKQCFDLKGAPAQRLEPRTDREETPYCKDFLRELRLENELTALHHLLFAKEYQEFLSECLARIDSLSDEARLQLSKFATLFLLTHNIREKDKKPAYELAEILRKEIHRSADFAGWLMAVFNDQLTLIEIMKNNPNKDMRKLIAELIIDVCRLAYPLEGEGTNNRLFETEDNPENPYPKTSLANLINLILRLVN